MSFCVLITGGRHFSDYPLLRRTLDALLVNRLPDVTLLTAGGPGVPMLAASYAKERGLEVAALVPEFGRFPEAAAIERRDAELVVRADAAVVVWDARNPATRRLWQLVNARGLPLHLIGGEVSKPKVKKITTPEPARRGLPD